MTLNQTIVNQWGIWQCSDNRLVNPATGKVEDDHSLKHVVLQCADGTALLAYAGAGRIGLVDISDWIRETLRGEGCTVDQSLILIRDNANRDLAPRLSHDSIRHMFSIGAFLAGRPWAAQIRNFNIVEGAATVLNHFETMARPILDSGQAFIFDPSGRAVAQSDQQKLSAIAAKRPREPKQFSSLMARINRRASQTATGRRFISPSCVTSYIPPGGQPCASEFHFVTSPPLRPLAVPTVFLGIDFTEIKKAMLRETPGTRMSDEELRRAGAQSVIPKNRLRR